jgi:hypothetical protein
MRNKTLYFFMLSLGMSLLSFHIAQAQGKPAIPETARIRLAESFKLGEALGKHVWEGWNKTPFAVLLVTTDYEFLVRHPKPSQDFTLLGYDSLLKSNVYFRKSAHSTSLAATFPVDDVPTIVIGYRVPEKPAKVSTGWVVTVLHEHFHQLQYSQPRYDADVEALDLSHGDKTGMWMLNFAFPYDSIELNSQVSALGKLLAEAIESRKEDLQPKLAAFLRARHQFQTMLSNDDYKYFSFQLWQEGMAMYTQYHIAKLAAIKYRPSKEFQSLEDYTSFEEVAHSIRQNILEQLSALPLKDYKRVAFYYLGAGEGLLLDRVNPKWRKRYLKDRFSTEGYFDVSRT